MMEAAVIVDLDGKPIYWHTPRNRTVVALPDSRSLWDVIWEHRGRIAGIAHSHPGSGRPGPSYEDVSTFATIESGLGRRLKWWITTEDEMILLKWAGPDKHQFAVAPFDGPHTWWDQLRELSGYAPKGLSGVPKEEENES